MRRSTRLVLCLAASSALGACSVLPEGPPTDASTAEFCAAYRASVTLVAREPGRPVENWARVQEAMQRIHAMGTPKGSDSDARTAVLRLSDIAVNAKSEGEARVQVDAFLKDHQAGFRVMEGYFGGLCGMAVPR